MMSTRIGCPLQREHTFTSNPGTSCGTRQEKTCGNERESGTQKANSSTLGFLGLSPSRSPASGGHVFPNPWIPTNSMRELDVIRHGLVGPSSLIVAVGSGIQDLDMAGTDFLSPLGSTL